MCTLSKNIKNIKNIQKILTDYIKKKFNLTGKFSYPVFRVKDILMTVTEINMTNGIKKPRFRLVKDDYKIEHDVIIHVFLFDNNEIKEEKDVLLFFKYRYYYTIKTDVNFMSFEHIPVNLKNKGE